MSLDNVAGIAGAEQSPAPITDTAVHIAGGAGPISVRDAARSVIDWRRKSAAGEATQATQSPNDQSNSGEDARAQGTQSGTQSVATSEPAKQSDPAQAGDDVGGESPPGETQSLDAADQQPPIEPPRSWSKEDKELFKALPRETQERR